MRMISFLKKRWYLVLVIILIAVFIFVRLRNSADSAEKDVDTYKVKKENLNETLTLSGEIDAEEKVSLKFQTSGRLAWVGVKEGDAVKKFQVIASLDQRDLKNRMQKYLNTYTSERLAFEQTKDDNWNKQFDLSESVREKAERTLKDSQYDLNNSVLDVELQSLSLEYANLWTPIDGIITHIDTPYSGVNITPAGSEFQVVNPDSVYLTVTAEQSDVVHLKKGMTGEVVFDAFPEDTYMGEVDYISYAPMTGESGTVYKVKVLLDSNAKKLPLRLAMTSDITFVIREINNAIGVSIKYLKNDSKGDYLNVERNGKKEKVYIKKGGEVDDMIEIKSGLQVGDLVYD